MWSPNDFEFVADRTWFSSLKFLLCALLGHFLLTLGLERWMSKRSSPVNVRPIQRINNVFIGVFSFTTFILINLLAYHHGRFQSLDQLICHREKPRGLYALLWYFFYLSKLWEFIDIYLVILNKTPVLGHFRWHHQTTPAVVLISLRNDLSIEWLTIASNSLLHTFLYPHFAGFWSVPRVLFVLGSLQLVVGLALSSYSILYHCDGSSAAKWFGLFIYLSYTIGFFNEHFHLFERFQMKFFRSKGNDRLDQMTNKLE